jgi:putative FmdB family regulatory protein
MPIYVYECNHCKSRTELLVRSDSTELPRCDCGDTMGKVMSPSWFRCYGQGFYKPSQR